MVDKEQTAISGEENYVGKLSVKTLGCNPSMVKTLPSEQTKLAICRIYGKANNVKVFENKEKATVDPYFLGTFEGINLQDGTVLRSGKVFLPSGISQVIEAAMRKAKSGDEDAEIAFAFEIRAVKATNPIGYSYEAASLKNPEQEDALAEMRKFVAGLPTFEQRQLQAAQVKGKTLEGQTKKSA